MNFGHSWPSHNFYYSPNSCQWYKFLEAIVVLKNILLHQHIPTTIYTFSNSNIINCTDFMQWHPNWTLSSTHKLIKFIFFGLPYSKLAPNLTQIIFALPNSMTKNKSNKKFSPPSNLSHVSTKETKQVINKNEINILCSNIQSINKHFNELNNLIIYII